MADIPITTHQRSARAILAAWRRNRPKAVADAISGSAAFELVESIEGALVMLDKDHNATLGATSEEVDTLRRRIDELENERNELQADVNSLKRRLGILADDLKPGATAEDARADCSVCGDTGFEVFNMEVIPCRSCVGMN
jgi:hypothetical protein